MAYRLDVPFTDIALTEQRLPERGDVVVFESKAADNRMVKRVIGVQGDIVEMQNNHLIVNGQAASYQSKDGLLYHETLGQLHRDIQLLPRASRMSSFQPVQVPEGHVLVLGDNRNNSADSRYYGFIPMSEISGKALKVIASLDEDNYYLPRSDRFLKAL
jgi:signal peptidase I